MSETPDKGPWAARISDVRPNEVVIESDDFNHDVSLTVRGDFESLTQKLQYAQRLAEAMNQMPGTRSLSWLKNYRAATKDVPPGIVQSGDDQLIQTREYAAAMLVMKQQFGYDLLGPDLQTLGLELALDALIIEHLDADSLDLVELLMGMEDELGYELPDEVYEPFEKKQKPFTVREFVKSVIKHRPTWKN